MVAIKEKGIRIDRERREIYVNGKETWFSQMEFKIIDCLLMADGFVCTPGYLGEQAGVTDGQANVAVHISRMRKKVGSMIETVPGSGYKIRREHRA